MVTLKIYNLVSQEIRTLVDQVQPAGFYKIMWDGNDNWGRALPSGIYLYRIHAGDFVEIKKMALVK